jgi:murein L,D-transpeptidase YafK
MQTMVNVVLTNLRRTKSLVFLGFLFAFTQAFAETKIEIDLDAHVLKLYQDEQVIKTYPIAYGRGGIGKKSRGDGKTPLGFYRIVSIKKSSGFGYFLHLNYPNIDDVTRAYREGLLDEKTFEQILSQIRNGMAPQNTLLGGYVGIHGLGGENPTKLNIHRHFNWTQGCIALTDAEVKDLLHYVSPGTPVVIKGSVQPTLNVAKQSNPPFTRKAIASQGEHP